MGTLTGVGWVALALRPVEPVMLFLLVVDPAVDAAVTHDELVAFLQLVATHDATEALQVVDVVQRAHDEVIGRNGLQTA